MKLFNSIKWRLQLWYGLILVLVLAGFGLTAYQLERNQRFSRIDDELHRRIGILGNGLHRPPPRGPAAGEPPFNRPPGEQLPDNVPPGLNFPPPTEFHLPAQEAHFFDDSSPNNFYFIIQNRDGKELARSTNVPPGATAIVNKITLRPPDARVRLQAVEFRNYRQTVNILPSGERIWVGCSIAPELRELRLTALKLTGVGGIILLLGLAGGWWLVGRAIHPINDISAAAVKISAGDLSRRINIAETESELGRLASVLNSTFARLEAAFAQQRQFTSDAAHELRTPVTVMLTQTQTALSRERAAAEYRETVEVCQRSAQRMRRLIESLLELARLDAGQETMKRLRFNLAATVNDCIEQLKPIASQCNVKILAELTEVEMNADAERLSQVITNLLANAIQYNRPDGEVRVKLEAQPGLAVLTVADTGRGISTEDLPHVFERFYRGDKSRTISNGNAGLGLAISKAIIEAQGGTIEVSSRENVGTIFTVRLPM